jgi:methyl-accepting chemotaxis protein
VSEVAASTREQSTSVGMMSEDMAAVERSTQNNARSAEGLAREAEALAVQADALRRLTSFFRVGSLEGIDLSEPFALPSDPQAPDSSPPPLDTSAPVLTGGGGSPPAGEAQSL